MSVLEANFFGTDEIKTAHAGEDIIQTNLPKKDWTYTPRPKFLNFMNFNECQVSINNSEPILLLEGQGLYFHDRPTYIGSFKILTDGVEYQLLGGY